jgi:DNA-binding beta-propeller fold protein YncE
VARSGNLLAVADVGLAGVHVIDLSARTHLLITGWREGEIEERLAAPIGVCLAGARVFVTDAKRGEVLEFDTAGGFRRRFGAEELARPVGVVYVRTCEQLYVVDGGAHCVVVFAMNGEAVARIGEPGNAPGAFNLPTHIAWDGANRLAVADSANFRVQLLDLDGAGAVTIGKKGDAAGDFALPKGVAFDSAGHLYTVDAQFENVQVFDQRGQLLLAFGREGGDAGEFALPAGLAIDDRDRVWIADSANHRIQVFDYLGDVP